MLPGAEQVAAEGAHAGGAHPATALPVPGGNPAWSIRQQGHCSFGPCKERRFEFGVFFPKEESSESPARPTPDAGSLPQGHTTASPTSSPRAGPGQKTPLTCGGLPLGVLCIGAQYGRRSAAEKTISAQPAPCTSPSRPWESALRPCTF